MKYKVQTLWISWVGLAGVINPGATCTRNTSADDFAPIEAMSLMKFDGTNWVLFGDVIAVD